MSSLTYFSRWHLRYIYNYISHIEKGFSYYGGLNKKRKEEITKKIDKILTLSPYEDQEEQILNLERELKTISYAIDQIAASKNYNKQGKKIEPHSFYLMNTLVTLDDNKKTYTVNYSSESNIYIFLTKYKLERLKKLLKEKLKAVPFEEIITPKYIGTDSQFTKKMKEKKLPLKDILKYDINSLLSKLKIKEELNICPKLESVLEQNDAMKEIKIYFQTFNDFGYSYYRSKDKTTSELTLFEEIYQRIEISNIEDIDSALSPTFMEIYPNETFLVSTLQNIYNTVDSSIRKQMHEELSLNEELMPITRKIIEYIQKYARNKDGNMYTEIEILNFLKQKNEIVNSKYYYDEEHLAEEININIAEDIIANLMKTRR